MQINVSCDPGTDQAAIALFVDERLRFVHLAKRPSKALSGPNAAKKYAQILGFEMVREVLGWLSSLERAHPLQDAPPGASLGIKRLTVEYQQIYMRGKARTKNPKDVLVLTLQGGLVIGGLGMMVDIDRTDAREPAAWKGQVPKDKMNGRVLEALHPEEHAVLAALGRLKHNHNILDAVGVGLEDLHRLRAAGPTGAASGPAGAAA
jgi:hypothetical protein